MEENVKEYKIVGTVTIGTDEYRDLIEDRFKALQDKQEWHDKWYKEYCEKDKLTQKCKKLEDELDKLRKFIAKNKALISDEGITVIMSLLGE